MKTVLLAGAAALALSAGGASAAVSHPGAVTHAVPHHMVSAPGKGGKTLYDQNTGDNGAGIVSSDFDSGSFDSYDSQIADDFVVPKGSNWQVTEVDVTGVYFNGYGPSDGQNVYFYKDNNGVPGDTVAECDNQQGGNNDTGSFTIKLDKKCKVNLTGSSGKAEAGKKTKGSTYWVSVQARMNFVGGEGEWGWDTNNTQVGNPAMFRSAGGFGCTDWDTLANCVGSYGQGPDVAFALLGKSK